MTETKTVRFERASATDVAEIVTLGAIMHAESPAWRNVDFDEYDVGQLVHLQLEDPAGIVVVVRDTTTEQIVGGFMGGVAPIWQSRKTLGLYDYALFLLPEYRRGRLAVELLREVFDLARTMGASVIQLGHATGLNPERGDRLYEHLGMKAIGTVFVKVL